MIGAIDEHVQKLDQGRKNMSRMVRNNEFVRFCKLIGADPSLPPHSQPAGAGVYHGSSTAMLRPATTHSDVRAAAGFSRPF